MSGPDVFSMAIAAVYAEFAYRCDRRGHPSWTCWWAGWAIVIGVSPLIGSVLRWLLA